MPRLKSDQYKSTYLSLREEIKREEIVLKEISDRISNENIFYKLFIKDRFSELWDRESIKISRRNIRAIKNMIDKENPLIIGFSGQHVKLIESFGDLSIVENENDGIRYYTLSSNVEIDQPENKV